ncbi:MAG: hypothetical protein AAB398_06155, partial [Pseudomonadota bacterium]
KILRKTRAVGLAELELALADGEDRALGPEMAAMVAACHFTAEQLAKTLRRLDGVVDGNLDAIATVEHGPSLPQ